ncbi:MAG: PPOX class F420-dependent oxidoreductase [Actinomycetota bacterium]|nr:PPOX class F420-dependent oxidoreductase [Actinomycetota bacterium]
MAELSEHAQELLRNPNVGFLATVDPSGWPQVTPVWVDVQDGRILVNTAIGRIKDRNVRGDPRVAISVAASNNPWDKIDVRGRIVDIVEGDEAERHIDRLAQKYIGQDTYPFRAPGERRVKLVIEPERVHEMPR